MAVINKGFEEHLTPNGTKTGDAEPTVAIEMEPFKQELADKVELEAANADDDTTFRESRYAKMIEGIHKAVHSFLSSKNIFIYTAIKVLLFLAYLGYFAYCMHIHFGDEDSVELLLFTIVVVLVVIKKTVPFKKFVSLKRILPDRLPAVIAAGKESKTLRIVLKWIMIWGSVLFLIIFLILDVLKDNPENLQSLIGLLGFNLIMFLASKSPAKVNFYTVFWGNTLQWLLAVIILRTEWGLEVFLWVGDKVSEFLDYALVGTEFVFGREYYRHRLALVMSSVMVYFNAMIFVLFHLGIIQVVINSFGRFLAFCMGTGPLESFAAAANVFISLAEAPMLLGPFLNVMTKSELHAVMACGFASIAGTVFAVYSQLGISTSHLLAASVMSAPAALAISKMVCPETERSVLTNVNYSKVDMRFRNVLHAASQGTVKALPLVGATVFNQISFVAIFDFLDSTLSWFAARADVQDFDFTTLCSYVFYPAAYAMGVQTRDCRSVASLLGVKLFGTPIMAYSSLASLQRNRATLETYFTNYPNGTWSYQSDDIFLDSTNTTLVGGVISERSEVIATYMLCGFSSITAIGVCLGVMVPLAKDRKDIIIALVVSALIVGNIASFLTAAVAGLLISGEPLPI